MEEEVAKIKEKNLNNYKESVKEIIKNNNKALFIDDINSLLQKPPLDSMDSIKNQLLVLAKKYNVVLNTENMEKLLQDYRDNISKDFESIQKEREKLLICNVSDFSPKKDMDTIKITKKQFSDINRKLKKESKSIIENNIEKYILKDIKKYISSDDLEDMVLNKFSDEFVKYMKKKYFKQLLESIELKVLVKDTTLFNGIKEQSERYIFVNRKSYLFKGNKDVN